MQVPFLWNARPWWRRTRWELVREGWAGQWWAGPARPPGGAASTAPPPRQLLQTWPPTGPRGGTWWHRCWRKGSAERCGRGRGRGAGAPKTRQRPKKGSAARQNSCSERGCNFYIFEARKVGIIVPMYKNNRKLFMNEKDKILDSSFCIVRAVVHEHSTFVQCHIPLMFSTLNTMSDHSYL